MANIVPQLDRLKAQLQTSGIQEKNQPLFQVINQLIDALRQGLNELSSQITTITIPSGGSSGTIITNGIGVMTSEIDPNGVDGNTLGLPGPQGPQGLTGLQGPPGFDGDDGECYCMPFVGNSILSGAIAGTYVQRIP